VFECFVSDIDSPGFQFHAAIAGALAKQSAKSRRLFRQSSQQVVDAENVKKEDGKPRGLSVYP